MWGWVGLAGLTLQVLSLRGDHRTQDKDLLATSQVMYKRLYSTQNTTDFLTQGQRRDLFPKQQNPPQFPTIPHSPGCLPLRGFTSPQPWQTSLAPLPGPSKLRRTGMDGIQRGWSISTSTNKLELLALLGCPTTVYSTFKDKDNEAR